jgi:hypothetical protein
VFFLSEAICVSPYHQCEFLVREISVFLLNKRCLIVAIQSHLAEEYVRRIFIGPYVHFLFDIERTVFEHAQKGFVHK